MTRGPEKPAVQALLVRVAHLLDEEHMARTIDGPIEAAAAAFTPLDSPNAFHRRFHQVIAAFVQHVYQQGLTPPRHFSTDQAGSEAIALLDAWYWGAHDRGYAAALLDALHPERDGVSLVLAQLESIIKENERRKYRRWVFASSVEALGWRAKLEIADQLLNVMRPYLPPQFHRCAGAQFVDDIPALIMMHIGTDASVQRLPDVAASS